MDATRLVSLTLDNLDDLPHPCRACVFWELDPVAGARAVDPADRQLEKEAWVSATLLQWGSCGTLLYHDQDPVGYVLYAPPAFVPRSSGFPTSPIGADAVQLVTARVHPQVRGQGFGRTLVQAAARDLRRRGYRAVEAFGDARAEHPSCLVAAEFLLRVGFKTIRPHHYWPRLRLDLRAAGVLSDEVEAALDQLLELLSPEPAVRPA
ncbi:MAG: GNAT family N-acetyltransferase [bacterium]